MPETKVKRRMLALELWGLGDLALAMPFLRSASGMYEVALLAKPHAKPLLRRFAPDVSLIPFDFPWTAFEGKYRLDRWPWRSLGDCLGRVRENGFSIGLSARPDPREHLLLSLLGCSRRLGFGRFGTSLLLTEPLPYPLSEHRANYWRQLGDKLGLPAPSAPGRRRLSRGGRVVIHTGAARAVRRWPVDRWSFVGRRLEAGGWKTVFLDETGTSLETLLQELEAADAFLGNDSGPGHLAALLGVPTFTLFGPQLSARFSPVHPQAAWLDGGACAYKPCKDACRYPTARCLEAIGAETAAAAIEAWLERCCRNGDTDGSGSPENEGGEPPLA